jgi:hypothetical protein
MTERKYKEVTLPAGTFRMYEDDPNIWVEAPRADEANRVNIAGSAYDRAQAALDEIVAGVKSRARAALGAGGRDAG